MPLLSSEVAFNRIVEHQNDKSILTDVELLIILNPLNEEDLSELHSLLSTGPKWESFRTLAERE